MKKVNCLRRHGHAPAVGWSLREKNAIRKERPLRTRLVGKCDQCAAAVRQSIALTATTRCFRFLTLPTRCWRSSNVVRAHGDGHGRRGEAPAAGRGHPPRPDGPGRPAPVQQRPPAVRGPRPAPGAAAGVQLPAEPAPGRGHHAAASSRLHKW